MTRQAEEWIELPEATAIISANSGRAISRDYVRLLGKEGYLTIKAKDKRQKLFLKSDVQAYSVGQRGRKPKQAQGAAGGA